MLLMETRTDESRGPLYMFLGLRDAILVASQSIQIAMSSAPKGDLASHSSARPTLMAMSVGACVDKFLNTTICWPLINPHSLSCLILTTNSAATEASRKDARPPMASYRPMRMQADCPTQSIISLWQPSAFYLRLAAPRPLVWEIWKRKVELILAGVLAVAHFVWVSAANLDSS